MGTMPGFTHTLDAVPLHLGSAACWLASVCLAGSVIYSAVASEADQAGRSDGTVRY